MILLKTHDGHINNEKYFINCYNYFTSPTITAREGKCLTYMKI